MDPWGGIERRLTVMLSRSSVLVSIFVLGSLIKSALLASESPPTSLNGSMTDSELTSRLAPAPIGGFTGSPVCLLCGSHRSRNSGKGCFSLVTDVPTLFLRYKVS
jgi:hypothetical protein